MHERRPLVFRLENEAVLDRMAERLKRGRRFSTRRREVVEHPVRQHQAVDVSGRLPDARPRQRARRVSLTALAYNLRRALNILGVEAMTAAVAA